jgi:hypothetical protein
VLPDDEAKVEGCCDSKGFHPPLFYTPFDWLQTDGKHIHAKAPPLPINDLICDITRGTALLEHWKKSLASLQDINI